MKKQMKSDLLNRELEVTLNLFGPLFKDKQNNLEQIPELKDWNHKKRIESILKNSFVVKFFRFQSKKEQRQVFEEQGFRDATELELFLVLLQFPELLKEKIVARGACKHVGQGDTFCLVHKGNSNCDSLSLSWECFNCCFGKRNEEGYYILALKI